MKQVLLIFLLCIWFIVGYGQTHSRNDAFYNYRAGNYQEAIELYQENIIQRTALSDHYMLGLCYQKIDSLAQAKAEFEMVIQNRGKTNPGDITMVQTFGALAVLYEHENQYRKALNCYQFYGSDFPKIKLDDLHLAGMHFYNAYSQARCFTAMGLPDSAVSVMTPYMFYSYRSLDPLLYLPNGPVNLSDSVRQDSITRYYLSLLQKRYTNQQIKAEFKKADQSFALTEDNSPVGQQGLVVKNVKCRIDIYGEHIVLAAHGVIVKTDELLKEDHDFSSTKDYELKYFHSLPIYRMVSALPEQ